MSPTKLLRAYFRTYPELKRMSTQAAFALLVGSSRSLIRAVEQRKTKMTPRLAKKISEATGVLAEWLTVDPVTEGYAIPSRDGRVWMPLHVLEHLPADEIERRLVGIQPYDPSDPVCPVPPPPVEKERVHTGWLCPRCEAVNAPWVDRCNCKPKDKS